MTVGVLALQGGFAVHLAALKRLGVHAVPVRSSADLTRLSGLVLPGGESTTQLDLLRELDMFGALDELWRSGVPILATCAGLILAAKGVEPQQRSLAWIDVDICRNAYGRQLDSFATRDDSGEHALVFIRAPRITRVGQEAQVLATHREEPVLVRHNNVVGATFHPELTDGLAIHRACFQPSGPLGGERRILQHVEQQLPHRAEHLGG